MKTSRDISIRWIAFAAITAGLSAAAVAQPRPVAPPRSELPAYAYPVRGGAISDQDASPPTNADWVLVEGDILMPANQRSFNHRNWPNGIVPFVFDSGAGLTNGEIGHLLRAMDWWSEVAGTKFVFRVNEPNYIRFTRSTIPNVSSSSVGMVGGAQDVRIWVNHFDSYRTVAHELSHALGFYHEQSRPDRDQYVTIEWQNIEDQFEHNFGRADGTHMLGHPYDYLSIMHYGSCSFSVCDDCDHDEAGCRTITTINSDYQDDIGESDYMSYWDIADMQYVYGEHDSRYVAPYGPGTGTLAEPMASVTAAHAAVPAAGSVLIFAGTYNEVGTFDGPATWRRHGGPVTIGRAP